MIELATEKCNLKIERVVLTSSEVAYIKVGVEISILLAEKQRQLRQKWPFGEVLLVRG